MIWAEYHSLLPRIVLELNGLGQMELLALGYDHTHSQPLSLCSSCHYCPCCYGTYATDWTAGARGAVLVFVCLKSFSDSRDRR